MFIFSTVHYVTLDLTSNVSSDAAVLNTELTCFHNDSALCVPIDERATSRFAIQKLIIIRGNSTTISEPQIERSDFKLVVWILHVTVIDSWNTQLHRNQNRTLWFRQSISTPLTTIGVVTNGKAAYGLLVRLFSTYRHVSPGPRHSDITVLCILCIQLLAQTISCRYT